MTLEGVDINRYVGATPRWILDGILMWASLRIQM